MKRYAVDILESESGWGSRIDETLYFDTLEEAKTYAKDYNAKYNNKPTVPAWYMMACEPRPITVIEAERAEKNV
jgi:hypothetical protein